MSSLHSKHNRILFKSKLFTALLFALLLLSSFAMIFPKLIPIFPTVKASNIITENFNDGNFNGWSEDNAGTYVTQVQAGAAIEGAYGLNCTATGDSRSVIYRDHTAVTNETVDFYVRFDALNPYAFGNDWLTKVYRLEGTIGQSQLAIGVMQNATAMYWVIDAYGASIVNPVGSPTTGVTYHFTAIIEEGASAHVWVRLDAVVLLDATVDNSGHGEPSREKFSAMRAGGSDTDSVRIDNIKIADTYEDVYPPADIIAPVVASLNANTTQVDAHVQLSASLTDTTGIDKVIFSWNNTASWVNQTAIQGSGTSYTAKFNGTWRNSADIISVKVYSNDTLGNAGVSIQYNFTLSVWYVPTHYVDMLLQADGTVLRMPNGTTIQLRGVNKAELCDDPDGAWMGNTMWTNASVIQELDAMQARGVNLIRVHGSVYDWQLGTNEEHSAISQVNAIKYLCELAAPKGMYIMYDGYRTSDYWSASNNTEQEPLPYPPYSNNTILHNEAEFETWCLDVMTTMKDYGNFLFDPWNEPNGPTFSAWATVLNVIFAQGRAAGFNQPIVVQYPLSCYVNLNYPTRAMGSDPLDWDASLVIDSHNNWLISDHKYRNQIIKGGAGNDYYAHTYADILQGCSDLQYFNTTQITHPLFIGEVGANFIWEGEDWVKEAEFFNNTLTIYDANGFSYCGFWWRYSGPYSLINADLSNTKGGDIFFNHTLYSSYTNSFQFTTSISNIPISNPINDNGPFAASDWRSRLVHANGYWWLFDAPNPSSGYYDGVCSSKDGASWTYRSFTSINPELTYAITNDNAFGMMVVASGNDIFIISTDGLLSPMVFKVHANSDGTLTWLSTVMLEANGRDYHVNHSGASAFPSIAVDVYGVPWVSYQNTTEGITSLYYAKATSSDATAFNSYFFRYCQTVSGTVGDIHFAPLPDGRMLFLYQQNLYGAATLKSKVWSNGIMGPEVGVSDMDISYNSMFDSCVDNTGNVNVIYPSDGAVNCIVYSSSTSTWSTSTTIRDSYGSVFLVQVAHYSQNDMIVVVGISDFTSAYVVAKKNGNWLDTQQVWDFPAGSISSDYFWYYSISKEMYNGTVGVAFAPLYTSGVYAGEGQIFFTLLDSNEGGVTLPPIYSILITSTPEITTTFKVNGTAYTTSYSYEFTLGNIYFLNCTTITKTIGATTYYFSHWQKVSGSGTFTSSGENLTLTPLGNMTVSMVYTTSTTDNPFPFQPGININALLQYLWNRDFVGFILACYVSSMGEWFYVILATIIGGALYIRTKNLAVLGVAWILTGAIFIPVLAIATPVIVVCFILGFGALLYKLYQHTT